MKSKPRSLTKPRYEITVTNPNTAPGYGGRQAVWSADIGRATLRLVRMGYRELGNVGVKAVIRHIRPHLPAEIRNAEVDTLYRGYRKTLEALPPDYERWVSLIRLWGGKQWDHNPDGPYEWVDELIAIAGAMARRLGERFDRWNEQTGDARQKFRRAENFRDRIKADPLNWPLRPKPALRSKPLEVAICDLMDRNPDRAWSVSQLARKLGAKFGVTLKALTHLTKSMRERIPPLLEWGDAGRSLMRRPGNGGPARKSCSTQMIEKLIEATNHAIELYELTGAVGAPTVTVVKTLQRNGIVRCRDFRRGTLVKLTASALARIDRGELLRDGRGAVLWEPAA